MSGLKIEQKASQPGYFYLKGSLDESADFSPLAVAGNQLTLDFEGLEKINSFGIRNCVEMLAKMKGKEVVYVNCAVIFIEQINMVASLAAGVKIASFYVPFTCNSCDIETTKKVTMDAAKAPGFVKAINSTFDCPQCSRKLELTDDEDMYFGFLADF